MREAISIGLALGLYMCGQAEVEVPVVAAPPTVQVMAPPMASHGGTVVMAGPTPVEVVTAHGGQVHAYVLGPNPTPLSTNVTVRLPDSQGAVHPIALTWDPNV